MGMKMEDGGAQTTLALLKLAKKIADAVVGDADQATVRSVFDRLPPAHPRASGGRGQIDQVGTGNTRNLRPGNVRERRARLSVLDWRRSATCHAGIAKAGAR